MNCHHHLYAHRLRTRFAVCVWSCALAFLCGGTLRAQTNARADSVVALLRELYEQGSYLSSEVEARRLLDTQSLPDSLRVQAEQYLAFSLVAQGKNAGAVDHLITILKIDSTFSLDPILTSPKILSVFGEARRQFGNLKPANHSPVLPGAQQQGRTVTFRTILFPGWEQAYQGRTAKGYTLLAAGVLSLGSTLVFDRKRRSARDEYLVADTPELAMSRYTVYNNSLKAEYYSLAAFLAFYVYSQFDAFFDLPPHIDPPMVQQGSHLQISLHVPF
jgi:hypothetical protein